MKKATLCCFFKLKTLSLLMAVLFFVYASAQTPEVLKDINGAATLHSQSTTGYSFVTMNGFAYFTADDGVNGHELWRTDGTEAGTSLVKDINPGISGIVTSGSATLVEMNGFLYFAATTTANGNELWKTDGTSAGTVMVKDINPGTTGTTLANLVVINNVLYFSATTSASGSELWKSDGTDAGTVLVKDINTGSASSTPQNFVNVNGTLFFTAITAANGRELWKSDGTTAGTVLAKDINAGTANTTFQNLTAFGSILLFSAIDAVNGQEIWKSDGTDAGTVIIKDLNPGSGSGSNGPFIIIGNQFCFVGNDGSTGTEIWLSDGTEAGTILLKDIYPGANSSNPGSFTVIGSTVYFTATDPVANVELWKTDGTSTGTVMVKDVMPGGINSSPTNLVNVNGTLFFSAQTVGIEGRELWKSDGTELGTVLVKDINPGAGSSSPVSLTNVNGLLYFTATSSTQLQLWKSDGTNGGTLPLNTSVVSGGTYVTLYALGNKLLFQHNGLLPGVPSTASGREPWVSDGTDAGTKLIKDINTTTDQGNPGPYVREGNTVFFAAADGVNGIELWKTDGTTTGTVLLKDINPGTSSSSPANFANVNGTIFFTATNASGTELWKTDGTEAGTVIVKDIRSGTSSSSPTLLTASGNTLFFIANDGTTGAELWKSDGTAAGTVLVADIVAGTGSPSIILLTDANGIVFFRATVTGLGSELWKSDGTAAGTVLVKDINPGSGSPNIDELVAYNGKVYFPANDGVNGEEPWVSDGTAAGTTLFVNIATSGSFPNSNPRYFAVAAGKLYFTAFTASTSFEPWVSDGTPAGTYMITEIVPGGAGSTPLGFTSLNGVVYFSADDGTVHGRELWKTDNTGPGTILVKDINTGSGDSSPEQLIAVGNNLFFRATMPGGGVEFFRSDGTDAGTIGYDLYPGTTTSTPDYLIALNDMALFTATHPVLGREIWKAIVSPAPSNSFSIVGDTIACENTTKIYTVSNVVGSNITYNWSLPAGGGTLTTNDSVATVTWNSTGSRNIALYLSNPGGSTITKQKNVEVITGGVPPTQAPVITAFGRTLTASNFPNGTYVQWYRNGTAITQANQPSYYAALDGTYTARFVSTCATGPESNAIVFAAAAIAQTISFPAIPDIVLTPIAKVKLDATASSGLPVFFQKISGPGFIQNDTLYISGSGTLVGDIVIKAMQPGNENYSPAPDVQQTFRVIRGNQVITFDSIPDMIFGPQLYQLTASSSVGLTVTYSIVAGSSYATIQSGNKIKLTGAGTVTVRASQIGNFNYFGATPVDRTFCIGVSTMNNITGDAAPCLNTYRYNAQKIPGANYIWTLSGGGILTTNLDTAWVQWQAPGNHTISVKANSSCDTVYSTEYSMQIATSANLPAPVTGMLPADSAIDQQLPLRLSWIPGSNTTQYDLYVWDAALPQPGTPYASNITDIFYTLPLNSLQHNTTYKWRVVSKNPCSQTAGPIQHFSIVPLPDLVVSDVQVPASATSGQTITVSWKVTNAGPGRTFPNSTWYDGVYFALDTVPFVSFAGSPNWSPSSWNSLTANGRPLLLGKKIRPSSLDSGQFYTNSLNFTLPLSYSFPVYVYVITDNEHPNWKIMQVTVANDTARAPAPMDIQLAPTPDLRVDSVFTTASAFSGSTINLTYKVKNYGVLTPSGGIWTDSVFLSQSPLFDRNNAIPLTLPKVNGSYYPNTSYAGFSNNTQLQSDSFYTRNASVVIPNFIFGTWFIYVKTNAGTTAATSIYEGALADNNLGQAQLQLYLTPTPKLTVNTLTVPVTAASTTQPIGINWNIRNDGFTDNIEKNRGHYLTMSTCQVSCTGPNCIGIANAVIKDSVVFGSSYWIDRVYLSTDSSNLNTSNAVLINEVKHGIENSGLYLDAPAPSYSFVSCPAIANGNINVSNVINPGSNFPKTLNFNVPSTLQPGNYYVYVYTNPTKTVFEYPGTPQIKRSALPIGIQRPDVSVPAISVPSASTGGQAIAISYNVQNNGPGTVFNHIRRDKIYISNSSSFDGSAQLIGTTIFTEDLPVGTAVPHTFNYNMPHATSGTKYFYVQSNYDSAFRETNYVNNISAAAAIAVTAAVPADFIVSSVQTADSVFTIFNSGIIYTVINNGSGAATGTWTDSVFISCSPIYTTTTSYFIGKRIQVRTIAPATAYTDTLNVNMKMGFEINNCFPGAMYGNAYFFVKANADTGAYEGSATNNNVGGSGNKVLVNPLVDHIVTTVNGPDVTTVGSAYSINWRVKNTGYNPNLQQYYNSWYDGIYFSADSVADGGDIKAFEQLKYLRLNRNQDSGFSKSPIVPYMPSGDYYVYVHNNFSNRIPAEKIVSNNVNFIREASGAAKKITVTLPPLSDLTDTILSAPPSVAAGQPVTVIYKVANNGTGITFPGTNFQNRLLLSADFVVNTNQGDRLLATRNRTSVLPAGQFYYDTVTVTIPSFITPGNYVLISQANSNNAVIETNSTNNLGFSLLSVYTPPVSDLIVSDVLRPDTVMLGYTIDTAKWVITNTSGEQARGYSKDGIYLSSGSLLDSTAVLIGIKDKNILMNPLQSDTVRMAPMVTGVVEGNYNMFIKTDLLNNIIESDEDNNTGMTAAPVYVKVKELPMNLDELNTLQKISRYYKLRIPDSLLGSTILVTLTTPDSLTMKNEMYISGGFVPTPANYDYRFEIPNYGNQQIVMTDVTDSVYYIMYRCVSPNPVVQNVKLKAVKLPFAILNVHTNAGGNIGNVTIRIRGSLFRDSMMAKLSNGATTIYASAVYYTNSTQVFATFPLQGKPQGIYDVTLIKPDLSEAVLPNGFSIVPANNGGLITGGGNNTGAGNGNEPGCDPGAASGLNSQLVVDLVVPSNVLLKRPIVILINYSNPTNFDIPAQSRILYSEAGLKMAFTKEGVPTGTTSLYLELIEPGGPPGIIRAGGSGTIIVHSRAADHIPDPNPVTWKLK
ncbi:MAG TPA: CARDB domain-containing protein [Chitinophagaceae bacterium]|nr:CARDB domain-containing protein [Chitinophagaceae bacterium]